jgi:hypothetical protein
LAVTVGFELSQKRRRRSEFVEYRAFRTLPNSCQLLPITTNCAQNVLMGLLRARSNDVIRLSRDPELTVSMRMQ